MKKILLRKLGIVLAVFIGVTNANSQILLSESFDGLTFVPVGWTNLLTSGGNNWTRVTAGTFPTQAPHSGAGEAKFDSYNVNGGVRSIVTPSLDFSAAGTKQVSFWMYRDNGYLSTADKIDVFVNTANNLTGATNIGTVARAINIAPIVAANGWYQYTFLVPTTFSTTTNYVFFRGTSAFGNNTFIDDITIKNYSVTVSACAYDYITNVTFSTINRTSACDVYTVYATPNPTVMQGQTYTLSVNTGGDSEGIRAWIDYNGDGLFDNLIGSELVLGPAYLGVPLASYSIAVTIPVGATPGVTRLRVRSNYHAAPLDAAGPQLYGEVEDYLVTIVASPVPQNDLCVNAILMTVPSTTTGTTAFATLEVPAPVPCLTPLTQPGVWYKVIGNGNKFGVDLCTTSTWDSRVFVFTGACGAWLCKTDNDDSGPLCVGAAASATWCSVVGVTYNILVTGALLSNTFDIAITQTAVVAPVISIAASSSPICNGASSILTASGATTYSWSTGATTSSISVTPSVSAVYSVSGTSQCSTAGVQSFSLTVNPNPTITVNSGAICIGSSFTMVPGGASTYTYSSGSAVVTPVSNTTYTVTGTSAAGCTGTSSAVSSVTVNSMPLVTVNSGTICSGSLFTMVPSGCTTYSYSSGSAVVSPTTTTTYTVTGSLAGCVGTSTAVSSVTVNPNPAVTVNSGAICSGQSFTMVPAGASTYVYSGGSAVVSPTTNTSYTVIGTSSVGCTANAVSTVTVNAAPILTVNSGSICSGNSFTMVPAGATSYTYSGGSAIVSPSVTTSYTVSGSNGGACVSNVVNTITVTATPVIIASSGAVCTGGSYTIIPTGATTYTYSSGSAVVTPTATTSYTVSGSNGSCQSSSVLTVTVNPTLSFSANSGSVCTGSTFTMTPSGASSYTYSSGSAAVTPTATTTYTIVGVNAVGCFGTQICTVTVNSLPTVSATTSSTILCSGASVVLTASTTAATTTYTWSSGATTMSTSVSPTVLTVYTVNVKDSITTCGASASLTVNVNPSPAVSATTSNSLICVGESAILTATTTAATLTYTWDSGATTMTTAVSPTVLTVYTVNVTDSISTCGASATVTVDVSPCTGINELASNSISIYPNPSYGFVKIILAPQFINKSSVAIYDALGKLIVTQELGSEVNSLNITELKNGMYIYKVLNNSNVVKIGKIVKQ